MTYPITIVDDFFEDPDAIVAMADELKYYPPDRGNWPGVRTKQLHVVEERFFNYFGEKIHLLATIRESENKRKTNENGQL